MELQVGVKALIKNSQGQYLLIQRQNPLPGDTDLKWDIPGGRIKPSESLPEALARELREEIGIKLTSRPVLVAAQDIFVRHINRHVVRLTYTLQLDDDIRLGNEHQNYTWATLTEALQLNLDPYISDILKELG